MKWIKNVFLFFKSQLNKDEKRLLIRVMGIFKESDTYLIANYDECNRLVKLTYKLEDKIDYLGKTGKLNSSEYDNTKYQYKCISTMIKDYSMTN